MSAAIDYNRLHQPVLLEETIRLLAPERGGNFIDATTGAAGHAEAVLRAGADVRLLALDQDADALALARTRLTPWADRVTFAQANFQDVVAVAEEQGFLPIDGILFDVGVSSMQIDRPERGFSYRENGPLDMRMDRNATVTAATVLNESDEETLIFIFRTYGEIREAKRLARAIIAKREEQPFQFTEDFRELAEAIVRQPGKRRGTANGRCFQALRIAVNDELEALDLALEETIEELAPGGRIAVISFHSLEDRLVKRTFREAANDCVCPPGLPVCVCDKQATLKVLTRRPITATAAELAENPRSSCAKLRAAERIQPVV